MTHLSLRSRLILVVLGLVAVGLAATDLLTYRALRSFLLDRVDQQLVAARDPVSFQLVESERRRRAPPVSDALIPPGTYAALIDADGRVVRSVSFGYEGQTTDVAAPAIGHSQLTQTSAFSVSSTRGSTRYRASVVPIDAAGDRLLLAIPLSEVTQTLRRLLVIELAATGGVLLVVGLASLTLVRKGLRPLDDIGEVAGAIASGDLSQRVPLAESHTEVGRLGLSLNAMLGHIETAFEARQASEARLRRFVADASHELRTPLTSIRGYAELFRRGAAERPDDLAKVMRRIEEEAERMGVLVDDLLLLARLDQGRPLERKPVDLVRVATDAVDDARAAAPDRPISLDAPDELVVTGDDVRLRQVAANLLANACQHTPSGTPVEVRVGADDATAVVDVVDHGPGLFPDEGDRVFERFYRADPSRARVGGGSGLGLSIVAAIAEAHGGTVSVASTPGEGARFRVVLPMEPASNGSSADAARLPPASQ